MLNITPAIPICFKKKKTFREQHVSSGTGSLIKRFSSGNCGTIATHECARPHTQAAVISLKRAVYNMFVQFQAESDSSEHPSPKKVREIQDVPA